MKSFLNISITALLIWSAPTLAGQPESAPVEIKYYEKIAINNPTKNNNIEVLYFFNTNCPSCQKFAPIFDEWKLKNTNNITIKELSFAPFKPWTWATKSYFVSKQLNKDLTRSDIENAQKKNNAGNVTDILRAADVVRQTTNEKRGHIMTLLSGSEVKTYEKHVNLLASKYGVTGVPSIVVLTRDSAYRISPEFKLSYSGMLKITDAITIYQSTKQQLAN